MTAPPRAARAVADVSTGTLFATVEIAVPPERVFRALTSAQEVPRWWGSDDLYRTTEWTMDLRPGGAWRAVGMGADGVPFSVEGEVLEVAPPHRLVHTWKAAWDGGHTTKITYRLEAIASGTRVTVRHEGFGDRAQSCEGHSEGWTRVLGWLAKGLLDPAAAPKFFFCRLLGPRPTFPADMRPEEAAAMKKHADYWRQEIAKGSTIVVGPVADPKGVFGMGVVRAPSEADARAMLAADPVIDARLGFSWELYSMMSAITAG